MTRPTFIVLERPEDHDLIPPHIRRGLECRLVVTLCGECPGCTVDLVEDPTTGRTQAQHDPSCPALETAVDELIRGWSR